MSKGKPREAENPVISAISYFPPVRLPYGWASVVLSGELLVSVEWEDTRERLSNVLSKKYPHAVENSRDRSGAGKMLKEYAAGEILSPGKVSALPVAWERIAGFHGKVLRETAKIPYGRTCTYGEIASRAGIPGASRATGAALARNPWPILVPCHRVVGEGGKLVGFGKGLPAKGSLLRFEERNLLLRKSCPIKRQNV